ncbi:hypothetical protein LINPERPRIM_LOCUS36319 [Linum perenne]
MQNYAHHRKAILMVARTAKNNGRSFYRCPFWQDSTTDCGFFKWTNDKPKIADRLWTGNDEVLVLELVLDELRSIQHNLDRLWHEIRYMWVLVGVFVCVSPVVTCFSVHFVIRVCNDMSLASLPSIC